MSKIDLYKGDCLEVMNKIEKESIDLIYIDPPFGIKQDEKFNMIAWKKTDYYEPIVYEMFEKILNENDLKFLSFLYPRLKKMCELLSEKGSIYVHIDWHVGHYVKILLDDIFGKENFLNDIVWSFNLIGGNAKKYEKNHEYIYWYKKNNSNYIFNKDDARQPYSKEFLSKLKMNENGDYVYSRGLGRDGIKLNRKKESVINPLGKSPSDVWDDVKNYSPTGNERLGYATQKPEKILERILKASSNENSIVADFFGGSGTTIAVAKRLGRSGIYCDQNQVAYDIAKKRIEDTVVEKG